MWLLLFHVSLNCSDVIPKGRAAEFRWRDATVKASFLYLQHCWSYREGMNELRCLCLLRWILEEKSITTEFNWLYYGELCVNYIIAMELTFQQSLICVSNYLSFPLNFELSSTPPLVISKSPSGSSICLGHTTSFSVFSSQPGVSNFHFLQFWHVPLTSPTSLMSFFQISYLFSV